MKNTSVLLLAALLTTACTPKERFEYTGELQTGSPREEQLEVKAPDKYKLTFNQKAYIYGVVDQISVHVQVKLYDSLDNVLGMFDGPARGPEVFYFETKGPGDYTLEVAPFKENEGEYAIELKVVEPVATDPVKRADQLFTPLTGDEVPGGVVGVIRDGKVIFSRAYGMADLTNHVAFTTETPSNIGSVSKQFTAMAILQLERQGKISLDDDVRKYIPELSDLGKVVTIRNMLDHTNGFREVYNLMPLTGWKGSDQLRQEDVLEMLERQEELQAPPGEEYNYNNSAFIMLAMIVERISGQKFPEWMAENVFGPLGMESTVVRADPVTIVPAGSRGYMEDSTGLKEAGDLYASYGAGGIYTTVEDFGKWLENFHDPKLGDSALIARLVTPDTLNNGDTMTYALGIGLGEFRGLKQYEHSGADIAHRATLVYFPEIDAGVAVMSNNASCRTGNIAYGMAAAFFKKDLEPEKENTGAVSDSTHVLVPERLLEAYTGKYKFIKLPVVIEYTLNDDVLTASIEGQPDVQLIPESDSVFGYKGVTASVTFRTDEMGKVTGAVHSQGGTEFELVPLEPYIPSPEDLKMYKGRYFCAELETIYTLEANDSTLVMKIRNTPDIKLSAIEEDVYKGDVFFIREVKFIRDEKGNVNSFTVSNGRTRGIRFDRI